MRGGGKQQVTIPVTAQTANNAPTEWLPVFAGSRYNIEASFTATAKKTTLSKILKIAGLATATYQTTQNIAWGKGQFKTANPNWLIPVGLGVALGADKLLPHKKAIAYIRYTLYNTDTVIQQVYIEPVSGNKKPVVFNGTVPANGFLTVAFVNTKLIPVTGGNITVSIQQFTDDDNLPVIKKIFDTELLLPEKKALLLPKIEPVPPVLPALYAVAESTAVIVNPITKKGNSHNTYNPPAPTPLKTQSSINKTLRLPNPLPQPVLPETPTTPLPFFLWEALPPKRFVINEEEPEPIDDGGHYALFDDSYSYSYGDGGIDSYDDGDPTLASSEIHGNQIWDFYSDGTLIIYYYDAYGNLYDISIWNAKSSDGEIIGDWDPIDAESYWYSYSYDPVTGTSAGDSRIPGDHIIRKKNRLPDNNGTATQWPSCCLFFSMDVIYSYFLPDNPTKPTLTQSDFISAYMASSGKSFGDVITNGFDASSLSNLYIFLDKYFDIVGLSTFNDVKTAIDKGHPVLGTITVSASGGVTFAHEVVIVGYNNDGSSIVYFDPADGNYHVTNVSNLTWLVEIKGLK